MLHGYVLDGDVDSVIALVESDPQVLSERDALGWTPLHCAIESCNLAMINALLAHGADVSVIGEGGESIIHHALRCSQNVCQPTFDVPFHFSVHRRTLCLSSRCCSPLEPRLIPLTTRA